MSSTGEIKTKGKFNIFEVPYYDIDIKNNRVLTEWGWCTYSYETIDANWMSFLDKKLKLNQINIPGTHDTGTYDIGKVWKSSTENNKIIDGSFLASVKSLTAQTQDLNIKDQLKNGIRYLDIRLHLDDKDELPYLYHGYFACYDSNTEDYLYLKNVLKYCIDFLVDHKDETIILHLKREGIKDKITNDDISKLIESIAKEKYNKEKRYLDYFYIPENIDKKYTNKYMPTLEETRGRIVFLSRSEFYYTDKTIEPTNKKTTENEPNYPIGFLRNVPVIFSSKYEICEPEIKGNFRCQDDYNLNKNLKWLIVENMLLEESEFNNKNNDLVHSLNFMNIAFTAFNYITTSATYMNKKLTKFLQDYSVPNEWFILDFPSINVIREIYNSNFGKNKPVYKPSAYIDLDVINKKNKESNFSFVFLLLVLFVILVIMIHIMI